MDWALSFNDPPQSGLHLGCADAQRERSQRVERVVGYAPLSEMSEHQRREFQGALLDADSFDDLPGKWQAAILQAEQDRPRLSVVVNDYFLELASGSTGGP
jgi:hypothetical protein